MSDLIVVIPGIGGSVLARHGQPVWAPQAGAALRAALSLGKNIRSLTLAGDDPSADDLGDGVTATALLPDLHVLPGLNWKIDGYGLLRQQLFARFDLQDGANYMELPYDWRRDNRVAARKLNRLARAQLAAWRASSGNAQAKLVLVGHSMGGIVARLFLEGEDEGWRITRRLVTFGTPYSGSMNALECLIDGFKPGWGPFELDYSAMLRSFTSVYQLLPAYRCVHDAGEWKRLDDVAWPPELDTARMAAALQLHRDLRAAVDAHGQALQRYDIRPLVGDTQRTRQGAQLVNGRLQLLHERSAGEDGGDGTVPRISAMPHELLQGWRNAAYFGEKHASLQNDAAVFEHLSGVLRGTDTQLLDIFPAGSIPVALEAEDVPSDEPMRLRARPRDPVPEITATLTDLARGTQRPVPLQQQNDGWFTADVEGLPAGDYRIGVDGPGLRKVTALASVVSRVELAQAVGA